MTHTHTHTETTSRGRGVCDADLTGLAPRFYPESQDVFWEVNHVIDGQVTSQESVKADDTLRSMVYKTTRPSSDGQRMIRPKIAVFIEPFTILGVVEALYHI